MHAAVAKRAAGTAASPLRRRAERLAADKVGGDAPTVTRS
jgi:hypothetical protein